MMSVLRTICNIFYIKIWHETGPLGTTSIKNSVDFYTAFVLITEFTLGLSHKFF